MWCLFDARPGDCQVALRKIRCTDNDSWLAQRMKWFAQNIQQRGHLLAMAWPPRNDEEATKPCNMAAVANRHHGQTNLHIPYGVQPDIREGAKFQVWQDIAAVLSAAQAARVILHTALSDWVVLAVDQRYESLHCRLKLPAAAAGPLLAVDNRLAEEEILLCDGTGKGRSCDTRS